MEMCKRARGEIQLPEVIIHHIQSYLDGKQATQTSVLSKSWYNAWLTRPNLDFDQRHFEVRAIYSSDGWNFDELKPQPQVADELSYFVDETMERYEGSNLKIASFKLFIRISRAGLVTLANESIVKALKMGVSDLDLEFETRKYALPKEVFEAESLVRLSAVWCEIYPLVDRKVLCSRLRYLRLEKVFVGEDTVRDIILGCPLIESFLLCDCRQLVEVRGSRKVTRKFTFRNPMIEHKNRNVGSFVDGAVKKVFEFCRLKYLLLQEVHLDTSFFRDFSLQFPCLEDLTLCYCNFNNAIQISSRSLKRISLTERKKLRAKFDFPSIQKFTYKGTLVPSVCFTPVSRDWESDISLCCNLRESWLLQLRTFLIQLSESRISLDLTRVAQKLMKKYMNSVKGLELYPKPVLENLILTDSTSKEYPIWLDGLFLSCCPKIITVTLHLPDGHLLERGNKKLLKTFERLIQEVSRSFCIPKQSMFQPCDFEKVTVDFIDMTYPEWQHMPLKTWFEAPPTLDYTKQVHLSMRLRTT